VTGGVLCGECLPGPAGAGGIPVSSCWLPVTVVVRAGSMIAKTNSTNRYETSPRSRNPVTGVAPVVTSLAQRGLLDASEFSIQDITDYTRHAAGAAPLF
jgi:hypothetical protein